ncbi:hypothetical protein ABIA31_004853 [Catenulispora sp. MAP5-51]
MSSQTSYARGVAEKIERTIRLLRDLGRTADAEPGKVIRWVRAESERRCADGDSAYLGDLGVELLQCHRAEPRAWQYLHTFDHLFKLLAGVCGNGDLSQALRLIAAGRDAGHDIDRLAAALLVAEGPRTGLAAAVEGSGDDGDTFRACLVHELVLREGTLARRPRIAEWASSAAMRRHPLGWLPLELAGFEAGWDQGPPAIGEADREIRIAPGERPAWPATDVSTQAVADAVSAAVLNWAEDSNGEIEARVFDLGEAVTPENILEALAGLGLQCLEAGSVPFRLAVFGVEAYVAWWILFHAALDGSAYGRGRHGAYSRLFAWRSLAALAGAAEGASPQEVWERAQQCTWFGFDAESPWYTHVFWDIGLVAVRPGGESLAVLAATDTD